MTPEYLLAFALGVVAGFAGLGLFIRMLYNWMDAHE